MTPLVAVSLKAYLGIDDTLRWAEALASAERAAGVDVVVFPTALAAPEASRILDRAGIAVGVQDISRFPAGAYTGETPAAFAAEAGARYAEIGHTERRRHFGETDAVVAEKAAAAVTAGLVPLLCVGEDQRGGVDEAITACAAQIAPVRDATEDADLVVAYEPVWAIGQPEPAPDAHIIAVAEGIRAHLPAHARLVYGGSAGAGLFGRLRGSVDGLFLGRFAHDTAALTNIISEVSKTSPSGK